MRWAPGGSGTWGTRYSVSLCNPLSVTRYPMLFDTEVSSCELLVVVQPLFIIELWANNSEVVMRCINCISLTIDG